MTNELIPNSAMNIVNQLFDIAEVPVKKRQGINDQCDVFVTNMLNKNSREAMERTVNELVGWMEMQQLQHSHKSNVFSTLSYCIKKAKSLLNQQGEETKLNP